MKSRFSIHEAILIAFLVGISLLMALLYRHETELQRNDLTRDISVAEQLLTTQLEADQSFLEQIAREKSEGALSREQFETRVAKRLLESPHILAVIWTQPSQALYWAAPNTRSASDFQSLRAPFAEQARLLRLTQSTNRPTYSEPYTATDGKSYIEYAVPLATETAFLGTLNAVIAISAFSRALLPPWFVNKYDVAIVNSDGATLARSDDRPRQSSGYLSQRQNLSLPWKRLQLEVTAQKRGSVLAGVTLGSTILLLTSMIAWSLYSLRKEGTRRTRSEQKALQINERFETVLDSLNVAVYVSDEITGALLYVNQHFRETFTLAPDMQIAAFEGQFAPNPNSLLPANVGDFETVNKSEIEHLSSKRWFITRVRRVRWVDGSAAQLHTMGDVTDRVDAERVKRAQQERLMLTSRLMTAGEMASTLAHEINQPLAAITNYLNGCMQRLRADSATVASIAPAIEKASQQAERAGKIIHRVREFVRTRDPQRESIALPSLIADVTRFSEPDASKPQHSFAINIAPDLPNVFADRIMIEQVLLNLVRNAREAMAERAVGERLVTLTAAVGADNMIVVSVSDRGHGISPELAQNLFSPFTTTKSDGMGMGLSICRSIIEYHEGQMRFQPNVPQGAIFEFTLPIAENA